MSDVRRGQLSKEDVLAALDELAVDHHGAADAGLPEGQVEDVVQAERNKGTFDDTKDKGPDISRAGYQTAEGEDAVLDDRPDEVHGNADEHVDDGRDDRNETRAAEER